MCMMNVQTKRGVSLLTVLLFMLVATIAATATYKWLTSENRSSAARLQKSAAYQSSQAGLESVRSWMTYHASDVGSLIRQYKAGGNTPILLNSRLKELTRSNQDYDVWLVGANTERSTYKLKILSSGKGPFGAVYNQVGIFNVDGLYQVTLSKKKQITATDFDYAYFGGSYLGAGDVTISSAIVNGNWKGNPQNVTNNFIVTGNAELSGNNVNIGKLGCIGGNVNIGNQGLNVTDLYVGGDAFGRITTQGDAYFEHNVMQGATGAIAIDGSVTLNGIMQTNQAATGYNVAIGKNLCLDNDARIRAGGTADGFVVNGDVYMPNAKNIAYGNIEDCLCENVFETYYPPSSTVVGSVSCAQHEFPTTEGGSYHLGNLISCSDKMNPVGSNQYAMMVLGATSESKVYMKGAKKAAGTGEGSYSNIRKGVDEKNTFRKSCPDDKRFVMRKTGDNTGYNWQSTYNGQYTFNPPPGTPETNDNLVYVCGSLVQESYNPKGTCNRCVCDVPCYYGGYGGYGGCGYGSRFCGNTWCNKYHQESYVCDVNQPVTDYTDDGWLYWGSEEGTNYTYYAFPEITAQNDMYFIFEGKEDFIKLDPQRRNDWAHFVAVPDGSQDGSAIPIHKVYNNKTVGFDKHFESPTDIHAYVYDFGPAEGGKTLYFDPTTGETKSYNYVDSKPTGSPYCYDDGSENGQYRPTCGVTPWFKSNGTVANAGPAEKGKVTCAEDVKARCETFWGTEQNNPCDGSKYKVDNILETGYDAFAEFAQKGCAAGITTWGPDLGKQLNSCYRENVSDETKKNQNLYNGYLVVSVTGAQGTNNCPSGTFDGDYIIIVNGNPIDCQNGLPPVTDGYRTFLFLKAGADNIGNATTKNYFIYTQDHIKSAKQLNLIGSIYADADYCAGMGDMQSSTLTYDPELMSDMVNAGILCEKSKMDDGATCGGQRSPGDPLPGGSGGDAGTTTIVKDESDAYYVSNAPTLSIKLESQYKSDEPLPVKEGGLEVAGDFVVVPRVIYLTKDPYGELSDYYNVLGLNGLSINKESGSVACDAGLPTTGKLYDRSSSGSAKLTKEEYKCSYTYNGISVPFYVKVSGESGSTPYVRFTESAVEMGATSSYEVTLSVPAHSTPLTIGIIRPEDIEGWTITDVMGSCSGNKCEFTVPANANRSDLTVFNVSTQSAGSGTAMFQLTSGEGYLIGTPGTLVMSISSNAYVNRSEATMDELNAFCENNSGCPADKSVWPNCTTTEPWVKASGCKTLTQNNSWSCPLNVDVSYEKTGDVTGCIPIITTNILDKNTLNAGETYSLSASLKARPMSLKLGFKGKNLGHQTIVATVIRSSSVSRVGVKKSCTYGTDVQSTDEHCVMDVFNGEQVKIGFEYSRPTEFNYWSCSGSSCPTDNSSSDVFSGITIVESGSTVYAHFGESDKHCFFDEFNTGVDCSDNPYCLLASEKWNVVGDPARIDYRDGYVAAKSSKTDKEGVIVLSNMATGSQGTLKAQFQVPQIPYSTKSKASALVKNSGLIFNASDANATNYLLMNLYEDNTGYLTAMLCTNDRTSCKETHFSAGYSKLVVTSLTVVTLSAEVSPSGIELTALVGRLGNISSYTASFNYETDLPGYTPAGTIVGFRLADPSFKVFDIGWRSTTFGAQCWDTYPTVSCSFRAAYAGGVVPMDSSVVPWVGLSSWFDTRGCQPSYYYKGDDACTRSTGSYEQCYSDKYVFTARGTHGAPAAEGSEVRTAKAGVGNCYNLSDDKDRMLAESEWGHCGEFWVGEMNFCKADQHFYQGERIVSTMENFSLPSGEVANLREATLKVNLENNEHSNVNIFLVSQDGLEVNHSKHFETNSTGLISIEVESLLDAANFDPENVYGVVVQVLGSDPSVTVKEIYSACPNVVSLNCENAITYDATQGAWTVSAVMTNFASAKSFKVTETHSFVSAQNFDCAIDPANCPAAESGKSATFSFAITDNPYKYNAGQNYQFKIDMTTKDEKSFSCSTGSNSVPAISAACGTISTNKVKVGEGLPRFDYSMQNCPTTGCPYKVSLIGTSTLDITTGQANGAGATATGAGNGSTTPLDPGTYQFKLESTDSDYPFEFCTSDEFTVRSAAADLDFDCGITKESWSIGVGNAEFYTTDNLYFTIQNKDNNSEAVTLKIAKDGAATSSSITVDAKDVGVKEALNIGKLPKGDYKYSITLGKEEVCSANVTVKDAMDEVTATCASVNVYPGQSTGSLVTLTGVDKIVENKSRQIKIGNDVKVSSDCNQYNCQEMLFNAPATVGSYDYKFFMDGIEKCSGTVNVSAALTCSVDKTNLKLGESFQFSATYFGNCSGANFTGEAANHYDCNLSYYVTPTTLGNDKEYKLTVYGSVGNAECTVKINVAEDAPTATCPTVPISVEPGSRYAFSPDAVTGCNVGCDYTIKKNGSTVVSNTTARSYKNGDATTEYDYTAGKYSFTVSNSAGSSTPCEFTVALAQPHVDCSGTFEVEPTEQVTFTPSVMSCTNCSYVIKQGDDVVKNGTYSGGDVSFNTLALSGTKSYSFIVSNSAGSDDCSINVKYKTPSVECPTGNYSVEPGATVSMIPQSLSNCTQGCSYVLSDASSNAIVNHTEKNYSSATAVPFASASAANISTYYFKVVNKAGVSSNECDFGVDYLKPTFTCPAGKTVSTGSNVAIEPTNIQNCTQGCDYKVSGGSANLNKTGNTTSGGSYNIGNVSETVSSDQTFYYSVTISNDAGMNSCDVAVKYTATVAEESAVCHYSSTNIYVGEKVLFSANNMKPLNQNLPVEFIVDGNLIDNNSGNNFWTGNEYPYSGGKKEYTFNTTGNHDIVFKLNGTEVCNQTIVVSSVPDNVLMLPVYSSPTQNKDYILNFSNGTIQFGCNSASCVFKMNGNDKVCSWSSAFTATGDFASGKTFNNINGCITQIQSY